jgi:hypothetical protein
MFYKAKVAVCSEIRTKHINAAWALRRIFECYSRWYVKLPLGFKMLTIKDPVVTLWTIWFNTQHFCFLLRTMPALLVILLYSTETSEVWGFHSGVSEDSNLGGGGVLCCDAGEVVTDVREICA